MAPIAGIVSIADLLMPPCRDPFTFSGECTPDHRVLAAKVVIVWILASLVTLAIRNRWHRRET